MNKASLKTFGITVGAVMVAGLAMYWLSDVELVKNAREGFGA